MDLLILQGLVDGQTTLRSATIGLGTAGQACSGIQKVVQAFISQLLTEKGSIPSSPDRGTDFLGAVNAGYVRDETLLKAQFGFAVTDITRQLSGEFADAPDDEVFAGAELLSWSSDGDTLIIKVRVFNAAGDDATYTASVGYVTPGV